MAKGAWGWVSTVLGAAALIAGQPYAIPLLLGAAAAGYAESKYQQRQAMRAYKKAFGAIGDNALAGSPTYSWDGPTTVTDPSLPVPICYGEVTVGGNIVNAWTETVNIYATKWDEITPTKIDESGNPLSGNWPAYTNIIKCDATSRGIKIKTNDVYKQDVDNIFWAGYRISYRITGGSTWIISHNLVRGGVTTVVSPERNLIERQYEVKIEFVGFKLAEWANTQIYSKVYSAHENSADTVNVAGHKDIQHLTVALCEGEIDSIDEGGVTLNDNKLSNFSEMFYEFDYVLGSNYQVSNPAYDNIVTENALSYKAIFSDASPFLLTTQNNDVQSLILILSFPQGLYQISGSGFSAWQVDLTVYYRKVGAGSWRTETKTIKVKNNNPFKQSIKIEVPQGQYEVKVVKTSEDPDSVNKVGEVWWVGLQEYVSQAQNFPNTALAYLQLQATDQSSGAIPNLNFKIRGKIVDVPRLTISSVTVPYELTYWNGTNYALDTIWNGNAAGTACTDTGTFDQQWTRNPIWCIRDLISNDYYGLKSYFQSTLNDTDLRLLAKYCDEKVDNGQGGTHKRFQLDIVIDSQDDARNVLERILSTLRGFGVWAENQYKIKINKAENPVQLFTMGNIIADSLTINYSSASDRFNVAKIVYPDANDPQARLGEVMIYDIQGSEPERVQTFNFIGITRRAQAVRLGRYLLNQSKYIKESIQFKAGLDSIACEAGDIIEFAHDVTQYGLASGRIKAATSNSITIDTPIASLDSQLTYKVKVKLANDTIEERTVNINSSVLPYTIVVTSNFTSTPPVDSIYTIGETGKVAKPYRVLSISRDSIQERQITAIEDNAGIYSDTGDAVEVINYSRLKNPLQVPDSVTNLTLKELTIDPGDGTKINNIWVGWNPPNTLGNPFDSPVVGTLTTGGSIPAGTYYCRYTWVGKGGETIASPATPITTTGSTSRITVNVPSFPQYAKYARVYVSATSGVEKFQGSITSNGTILTLTTVTSSGLLIPVSNSTQSDTVYDRAKIYLSDSAGAYWEYKGESRGNFIIENVQRLTYKVAVVSVSLYGIAQSIADAAKADISIGGKSVAPSDVTFIDANYTTTDQATYATNSPEATQNSTIDDWNYIYSILLRWNPIPDKDLAFYELRTEDANWGVVNDKYIHQTTATSYEFGRPKDVAYTFYIKARDTSGNYSINAGSITIGNKVPELSDVYVDFTGKDCRLWWQEVQDNDFLEYQVLVYADQGRNKLLRLERLRSPAYTYTYESNVHDNGGLGTRYLYFTIKSIDKVGQIGSKNINAINLAPAAPEGFRAMNAYGAVFLDWNHVFDPDLRGYYVYVDDLQTAFTSSPNYRHLGTEGVTYTYYVTSVDTFGEGGRSIDLQGTPFGALLDTVPPGVPTGLALQTTVRTLADGTTISSITATWDINAESDFAYYEIQVKEGAGNYFSLGFMSSAKWTFDAMSGLTYYVQVRAIDIYGNMSNWCNEVSLAAASDTVPPGVPTSFSAVSSFKYIFLSWTNPTDKDLSGIEVWRSDSNDRALATKVASINADKYVDNIGSAGITRYYWIRAYDNSGNVSGWTPVGATSGISATTGGINSTDISSFAISASKLFVKIPVLEGDSWSDNMPSAGNISWGAHVLYYNGVAYSIQASSTNLKYVYWVYPNTFYSTSPTNPTLTDTQFVIAVNLNGIHDLAWNAIANQTIGSAYIENAAVINAKIANLAVDDAKIANLDASKITASSVISNTVVVSGGSTLLNIDGWSSNPAARINTQATYIDPGKILISGSTLLSNWRNGTDNTKIEGGNIAADTVLANSVKIGLRGVDITGLTFKPNEGQTNRLYWDAGKISYYDSSQIYNIASDAVVHSGSPTEVIYVYWNKDSTSLATTIDRASAYTANSIVLATYTGGTGLITSYGRTTITGDFIKTGTIQASHLSVTNLAAINSNLGTVVTGMIQANNPTYNFWNLATGEFSLGGNSGSSTFHVATDGTVTISGYTGGAGNKTYAQATAPTSGMEAGDLWLNTTTLITYRYNGTDWNTEFRAAASWSNVSGAGRPADYATVGAVWGTNVGNRPVELTDGRIPTAINNSGALMHSGQTLISGGYIRTGLVLADYVAAGTLQGSTIQTTIAPTGQRFVLSNIDNMAHFYDASGVERLTMGAPLVSGVNTVVYAYGSINGLHGVTQGSGTGVTAQSTASGYGLKCLSTSSGIPLNIVPQTNWGSTPSVAATGGSFAVNVNNRLFYAHEAWRRVAYGVFGTVTSAGTENSDDFSVSKPSAGTYNITFTNTFSTVPVVVVTVGDTNNGTAARRQSVTTTGFTVLTYTGSAQTLQDSDFSFMAVAP